MPFVIRDFKSFTSRQIREILSDKSNVGSRREWLLWMFERAGKTNKRNDNYQFWQQHNHPIELSTNEMIDQRLNYVHQNPVEAGFVFKSEDWVWSSADNMQVKMAKLSCVICNRADALLILGRSGCYDQRE